MGLKKSFEICSKERRSPNLPVLAAERSPNLHVLTRERNPNLPVLAHHGTSQRERRGNFGFPLENKPAWESKQRK